MATALVDNLAGKWKPEKYTDDYRDNLMKVIKAKMKGKQAHVVAEERPRDAKVVDLMERLRQSLDASRDKKGTGRQQAPAALRKRARTTKRRRHVA